MTKEQEAALKEKQDKEESAEIAAEEAKKSGVDMGGAMKETKPEATSAAAPAGDAKSEAKMQHSSDAPDDGASLLQEKVEKSWAAITSWDPIIASFDQFVQLNPLFFQDEQK